jgi:Tol biopolymer transport system component
MKSQRNIARQFFGLTLTLVGLMSWTLPIHLPERTVQAATRTRVTEPTGQPVSRAVANGRIAFVSSVVGSSDIYTMNPDGSDRKQLTFSQEFEGQPVWSSDGTKIAFTRSSGPLSEIFVMNADGSDQRRLTSGDDNSPTWSPDGIKIAFWRRDAPNTTRGGIFVMNADGSDQRAVASSFDGPAWSPDGLKLAFGSGGIYLIKVDGSNRTQITQPADLDWDVDNAPAWSPDGSKITFTRGTECFFGGCESAQLWVVNADGSNPTKLTDIWAFTSAWSPDGTKIIFSASIAGSGGADLLMMNPDGSGLTNITNTNDKFEHSPSWQPISSSACTNPIDCADFFVRQHYRDFLGRESDQAGLDFWTNEITSCGGDQACIEIKRINDSGSFFHSIEFQETGYLVYRMYKAAYGDLPNSPVPIKLDEFLPDTQRIGQGVIVRQAGWAQVLENNKRNFALEFVQRARFTSAFSPTTSAAEFVDKLIQNSSNPLSPTERNLLVIDLASGARSRADVLRAVAENRNLAQTEFNRAFVLMQYFGYLRRNPNDAPDGNFVGYNFWLDKLNRFNGDFTGAEMVKAFITSTEYRQRFGP